MKRAFLALVFFVLLTTITSVSAAECTHIANGGGGITEGMVLEHVIDGHEVFVELVISDGKKASFRINDELTKPLEECEVATIDLGNTIVRIWPYIIDNSDTVAYAIGSGAEALDDSHGEQLVIVGERAPTNDVLTGIDIMNFLQGNGYDAPLGSAMIDTEAYKEISFGELHRHVFYVIDGNKILVLIGGDVSQEGEELALKARTQFKKNGFALFVNENPKKEDLLVAYEGGKRPDYVNEPEPEPVPVACAMDVKLCPDGSYVGRVAPECAFEECPEFVPQDEGEQEGQEVVCQGCERDNECIPYGTILSAQRYCADDGVISAQKNQNMRCDHDYECKDELCQKGYCVHVKAKNQNIIVRLISWLSSILR